MGSGRFATFMRARNFLIVVPLVALAIAGCGGDDGGEEAATTPAVTTTAAPSLSKEELIAQGDAICAEVNAALAAVSSNTTESQVGQVADLYIGMVESLQGLGTPDDETGYDAVTSAADNLAQAEGDAKLADERDDSAALSTAQTEATSAVISFQEATAAYGFQSCSLGPGVSATAPSDSSSQATTPTTPTAPSTTPTTPAPAPNTGGAGGTAGSAGGGSTGGGSAGGGTGGGGSTGGPSSGGIGPG